MDTQKIIVGTLVVAIEDGKRTAQVIADELRVALLRDAEGQSVAYKRVLERA